MVLTRPTPGLEERAQSTQLLQELVKWLPPDLFLTCLSRVSAFSVLASNRPLPHLPFPGECLCLGPSMTCT